MIETPSNPFQFCSEPVAGLDLSLRSPAITIILPTTKPSYIVPLESCHHYYLTDKKSLIGTRGNMHGELFGAFGSDGERYETISEWVIKVLQQHKVKHVGIEGYAFSRNWNSLTMLAENMGLLKYYLYKNSITYDLYTPSSIKKCASGSGAADKRMMVAAYAIDTGHDIMGSFGKKPTDKPINPIHDIADSYYLACSARIGNAVQNRNFAISKPLAKRRRK
jgi:hypothetical protein